MPVAQSQPQESYELRRTRVQLRVESAPRGTQQNMSYDLRVVPTRVSQVVRGVHIDDALLERISRWLDEHGVRNL